MLRGQGSQGMTHDRLQHTASWGIHRPQSPPLPWLSPPMGSKQLETNQAKQSEVVNMVSFVDSSISHVSLWRTKILLLEMQTIEE